VSRFVGIDFSGAARPWRPLLDRPTVWLAVAEDDGYGTRLKGLMPVQSLQGDVPPFDRLVQFLARADFDVAAIDAPFALPLVHLPDGRRSELLRRVSLLPNAIDRPFPRGADIVALGEAVAPKAEAKPLRQTEQYWVERGVNARSTVWCGARGGAPFAAGSFACDRAFGPTVLALGTNATWLACRGLPCGPTSSMGIASSGLFEILSYQSPCRYIGKFAYPN